MSTQVAANVFGVMLHYKLLNIIKIASTCSENTKKNLRIISESYLGNYLYRCRRCNAQQLSYKLLIVYMNVYVLSIPYVFCD